MSVKFNTGVHFRNKDGTWDDSYMAEQVHLNDDYIGLKNKPVQYITEDSINLVELDEGIYQVFHNGTSITLSNNSQETRIIPDKSVLFVAKVYQNTKAQIFIDGAFYEIDQNTELQTEFDGTKLATMNDVGGSPSSLVGDNVNIEIEDNTIKAIVASTDDLLEDLYEEGLVSPITATFEDGTEAVLTFEDGTIIVY